MTQLLPKLRVRFGEPVGVELFFAFPDLTGNESTYLDANVAAASGTLSANGTNFAVDQYIVIGTPGTERCEIIKLHASSAPNSTTITLASNTTFAHTRGEKVTFIPYNQIEPFRSTDSGSSYGALSAISIRPDALETYLQRASDASTDYYKFRFKNSTATTYSSYSDPVIATNFGDNTVWAVKKRALRSLGEKVGGLITDDFLNDALNEARREVDQDPRIFRWAFRTQFNYDAGDCIPGRYSLTAPTDLRDPNTNKNLLEVRIGRNRSALTYQDFARWQENYNNIAHTTLNGALSSGASSIVLTSSGDFDESGTVYLAAESISGTLDSATYTSNTESTATLGGVSGVTDNHATLRDVWQGANFGLPQAYTINNGVIYFDLPFMDSLAGENIYLSYYKELSAIDSDGDELDEPYYDLFVPYLRWKIKYLKSNGKLNPKEDGDYLLWEAGKDKLISQELGQTPLQLVPDLDDYLI